MIEEALASIDESPRCATWQTELKCLLDTKATLDDWELLLAEVSRNGTALDNDALDRLNNTIRGALTAKVSKIAGQDEAIEYLEKFISEDLNGQLNKNGALIVLRDICRAYAKLSDSDDGRH